VIVEATKVCGKCGEPKPLSQFYSYARSSDGLQYQCKQCFGVLKKLWKQQNPAKSLLTYAIHNGKKRGFNCTLTLEWVEQRLAGVCEVTGLPFVLGHRRHAFMPSIDRIDSSKPYTPENCRVVLWIINSAKNDLEEDDFQSALRQVADAMLERC